MKVDMKPMTAIILAGGNSQRMRREKPLLPVQGKTLVQHVADNITPFFSEIIISTQEPDRFAFLPYPIVADEKKGHGPFMGILSGLKASSHSINFIIACDIPEINPSFLLSMIEYTDAYEIVVPVTSDNHFEPLFAFYHQDLINRIENLINHQVNKIIDLYPLARVKTIPMNSNHWYLNLNTEPEYLNYIKNLRNPRT